MSTSSANMAILTLCRALVGLLLSLSPLACDLMGWRGAGTSGAAGMYVNFRLLLLVDILTKYQRCILLLRWPSHVPRWHPRILPLSRLRVHRLPLLRLFLANPRLNSPALLQRLRSICALRLCPIHRAQHPSLHRLHGILFPIHNYTHFRLPHLLNTHQHRIRNHLLHPHAGVCLGRGDVLVRSRCGCDRCSGEIQEDGCGAWLSHRCWGTVLHVYSSCVVDFRLCHVGDCGVAYYHPRGGFESGDWSQAER